MNARESQLQASATAELQRTNQLYSALNSIYQRIVLSGSRDELFNGVTRALVDSGAIRMAWVGWADPASQRLLPVAQFGDEDGYLQAVEIRIDDSPKGRGPSGMAFRTGQPQLVDDLMNDPISAPWRGEAAKRQWRASAAFPLHCGGVAKGVLTVYAHEPAYFRDGKLSVLLSAAADISSALDRLAHEAERARLEEASQIAAKRLELALDTAEIGIWDWHIASGRIVYDDRMYAMHGLSPGSPIDYRIWARLVHPDDLPEQRKVLARVVDEGIVGRCQFRIVLPNGQIRHMYSIETLHCDAQGKPANVVGINVDITDRMEAGLARREMERQLRESRQRYRLLFDASPNAKALTDVATRRIIEVNEAALQMFGYERAEMIGKHADELFNPLDLPVVERERQREGRDALARTANLRLMRKDGSTVYAEIATKQIELEGKPVTLAVAWDVTARVEAEQQLRQSQQRYRQVFEANPDPMTLIDAETHRILAVNDAMVRQYGWSREELIGMSADRLSRPEDMPTIRRLRDAGQTLRTGFPQVRKDGSLFDAEVVVNRIELDGKPTNLGVLRDVTARLEAERQRDAAEVQLRQAQKMEAVGQLTGGVAHDFNNILMVILANVEQLLEDDALAVDQRTMLENIASSGERAAELTHRLLAFSRKQRLVPRLTNVNDLVSSVAKMLRRTLGENIEIEAVLAADLGVVNVDRAQVESALLNLSVNARDAMPAGGRLLIETSNSELDEAYAAAHSEVEAGSYIMLAVSDTGSGISPENLQRVFEPFFTTKEVGKGTGLGLSMVYGFVKQSNGHVKIHSEVGRGTTIRIFLPRVDAVPKSEEEKAALPPRGHERIVMVEDDDLVRKSLAVQLRSLGYEVAEFARGRQALEWIERGGPADLLLVDVVMPEIDGSTVARVAEKLRPGIKVLYMSGYSESSPILNNNVPAGADVLSKPFRKVDLAKRIREALTR